MCFQPHMSSAALATNLLMRACSRCLLGLVSRKLHKAEEKTRVDTAVSEDQRELFTTCIYPESRLHSTREDCGTQQILIQGRADACPQLSCRGCGTSER